MIKIRDLSFTYPGSDVKTLNNINLNIEEGDFVAIMGNNGCGKSTLCKCLNGLIPEFIVGDFLGDVLIDGQNTKEMTTGDIAANVGYVYQDFENQIVCPKVIDDVSFAPLNYAYEDYKERGINALKLCSIEHKAEDYIWQMSGGQKHLLAIAGALSLNPRILILDEPVAQLDPAHARDVYKVLKKLNEDHKITVIVIEHHTEFVAEFCKNVILLKDGTVKWKLNSKDALRRVSELSESGIYAPQITLAAHELSNMGIKSDKTVYPVDYSEGMKYFKEIIFDKFDFKIKEIVPEKKESAISLNNIYLNYKGVKDEKKDIFKNFNLDIKKGEKIALIGSNGAGKSTLMKLVMGIIKPEKGDIKVGGDISYVYQNPEEMFIKDSIEKDIEFSMKIRKVKDYEKETYNLLERFSLLDIKDRDGRLLSGGQMRRASLAIGTALKPEILMLDEPTANLDIRTRKEIIKTLSLLKDITETVIIATHDMQLVCEWADRIIVLNNGEIVGDSVKEEIFKDEYIKNLTGIRAPEIARMSELLNLEKVYFTVNEFVEAAVKGAKNVG